MARERRGEKRGLIIEHHCRAGPSKLVDAPEI